MLQNLSERITAAGVQIKDASPTQGLQDELTFEITPGSESVSISSYKIWREAALAKATGAPVGNVEVFAYYPDGTMRFGQGLAVDKAPLDGWQEAPAVDADFAIAQTKSAVLDAAPEGIMCASANLSVDIDGYRTIEVDLTAEPDTLAASGFRDVLAALWARTTSLNKDGAELVSLTVKVSSASGELLIWDTYDFQMSLETGWHAQSVAPNWISVPSQADKTTGSSAK
jgi:hypothetical protein